MVRTFSVSGTCDMGSKNSASACACGVIHIEDNPCLKAYAAADQGKFGEAYELVEHNRCSYFPIATRQFATNPAEAERQLRRSSDPHDLAIGFARLSEGASNRGNIQDALRLADEAERISGQYPTELVQGIAREWAKRDGPKPALKWALARPTPDQRTSALIGIAEALGHARPTKGIHPDLT